MPRRSSMRSIDGRSLDLDDVVAVARQGERVALAPAAAKRVDASRRALEKVIAKGSLAYGIKTGFGELASVEISDADVRTLQLNLLRSHAIGQGPPLRRDEVRAAILLRANTLAMGYSGVRRLLVTRLLDFLNRGVHPVIPSRGSLGASGDLAPLAHLGLVLVGEGEAEVGGQLLPGAKALATAKLAPMHPAGPRGRPGGPRRCGRVPADRDERRDGQPAHLPRGDERQRRELPRAVALDGARPCGLGDGRPRGLLGAPDRATRRHATERAAPLPDAEERPALRDDDRAVRRGRLREREQSPRPSSVRRLDPDLREPGRLRADGDGGRPEGPAVPGERGAGRGPGGPRGRPGPGVPQTASSRRGPSGRVRVRPLRGPPARRGPLARAGRESDPGMDGDRPTPRGRGERRGPPRLITRRRLAASGSRPGSGPRGSRTARGSPGRSRSG